MLNRKYRATRIDIAGTIQTGIPAFGKVISAKISRNNAEKVGFAIVISKKIDKTSVGRHHLKRTMSAVLEAALPSMNHDFKKTIVFFVKNAPTPLFPVHMKKDMKEILIQADFFAK